MFAGIYLRPVAEAQRPCALGSWGPGFAESEVIFCPLLLLRLRLRFPLRFLRLRFLLLLFLFLLLLPAEPYNQLIQSATPPYRDARIAAPPPLCISLAIPRARQRPRHQPPIIAPLTN